MKVSARNVLGATVTAVTPGTVNAEVELSLGGADRLVAVVTVDSMKELALAPGRAVLVLLKAPLVMLARGADSGVSARNVLAGRVESVSSGTVNVEVALRLHGGSELMAVVTRDAARELALAPGVEAVAIIKSSSVILGVQD